MQPLRSAWSEWQQRLRDAAYRAHTPQLSPDEMLAIVTRVMQTQEWREGQAQYRRFHFVKWLVDTGHLGRG